MMRGLLGGATAALLLVCSIGLPAQAPPPSAQAWVRKLAEPWPTADKLRERRIAAENRALFRGNEPIAVTLTADFKAVNKDRTVSSKRRYPATLTVAGASGPPLAVKLGSRGHSRLHPATCGFVPLRVEFPPEAAGSMFDGQKALKLVTHCRDTDDYEQYVLHEHLVYRLFNLMTPRSLRARLVKATYVDGPSGKTVASRYAMFLEDDDDVARRMEGRSIDIPGLGFKDVDPESLTLMSLFQYMIANTDYSIVKLHNVKLIQTPNRTLYSVPYDFDYSGLVNTRYSNPSKILPIVSVRERLYRGPCQTEAELEPMLERFRSKKGELMAVYESLPDMRDAGRRDAQKFLQEFFSIAERKDRVKKALVDGCTKSAGM